MQSAELTRGTIDQVKGMDLSSGVTEIGCDIDSRRLDGRVNDDAAITLEFVFRAGAECALAALNLGIATTDRRPVQLQL